jgi:hypothetical protein
LLFAVVNGSGSFCVSVRYTARKQNFAVWAEKRIHAYQRTLSATIRGRRRKQSERPNEPATGKENVETAC